MAKRSGYGGFGGGQGMQMQNLMRQAQRMQQETEENKQKLNEEEFSASSGGGVVKVTMTGDKKLKSIEIDKEAVDPDDVETLQDLILAAVNEAMGQVDAESEKLFGSMSGLGL